jgi:hypothetical protein
MRILDGQIAAIALQEKATRNIKNFSGYHLELINPFQ